VKLFAGSPIKSLEKNQPAENNFLNALRELGEKKFAGYAALSINAPPGFQQAVVLMDGGKIVGGAFEFLKNGFELKG